MKVKASECPNCLSVLDRSTSATDKGDPVPGSFSVCSRCGALLRYGADMDLERMTDEDMELLEAEAPHLAAKLRELSRLFRKAAQAGLRAIILDPDDLSSLAKEIVKTATTPRTSR